MSNEIKNTLFRFVTMRAPELSNEKNKNKRFIFRGEKQKEDQIRPFDHAVKTKPNSTSKWNAMKTCSFDQAFTDEKAAKIFNESFYNLGIWIARNKNSYTTTDLLTEIEKSGIQEELNIYELDVLWNNLFYQVITQKDFHVKESVMQMLIANHVYANKAALTATLNLEAQQRMEGQPPLETVKPVLDMELINYIVNAKVVLPKDLFVEEETTTSVASMTNKTGDATIEEIDVNQPMESLPSNEMKRVQDLVSAQTSIERNNLLKKELEKAEKRHRKEYQTAYNKAQEEYQELTKPILAKYNENVRELKEKWCSVRDPKIPYDPTDPCNQIPAIPKPELPKFNFEFRNEMDLNYLKEVLSEASFTTLLELLEITPTETTYSKIAADDSGGEGNGSSNTGAQNPYLDYNDYGGGSYSDTYTQIGNSNSQNTQVIVNNTPSQSTTSVSIGGVIVPLATTSGATPFSYQICPKQNNTRSEFYLTIELPDSSLDFIPSSSYVQLLGASGGMGGFSLVSKNGTTLCLKLIASYPLTDEVTATKIEGTIKFSNGMIKTFSIPTSTRSSIFKTCFSGVLTDKSGSSTGSNTSSNTAVETFIPSGFGVKQLGIADYKKVEQTVQGYVEGDVAHIENVMARERREKSTRKLSRSEVTETQSTDTEREQTTDTSTTNRFELQTEIAKVLQENKDQSVNAHVDGSYGTVSFGVAAGMASHSSKEDSTKHAKTQAQEVTAKATDRITTKIHNERVSKMIEEFEENNLHEFDNRKGDKHVVGVYRWVDKIYKNRILNFGKRLMFEFMIPEPAKLHLLGMTENKGASLLIPPTDPRKYEDDPNTSISSKLNLKDYTCVNEITAKYWGSIFNTEYKTEPEQFISIGKSFSSAPGNGDGSEWDEIATKNDEISIPKGYKTISGCGIVDVPVEEGHIGWTLFLGNKSLDGSATHINLNKYSESIPVSYRFIGYHTTLVNIEIKCERTDESYFQWQQETFKAIIDAYDEAVKQYNQKLAEELAKGNAIKGENPGFYRQIENLILRKNCISYIISQDETKKRTYGRDMFKPLGNDRNGTPIKTMFNNLEVNVGSDLDDYAAFAKFIEQAFEWDIMSYNFYPYYWGAKKDWAQLYQYDNNDPLFRNFMQAGMARVVVTVRPGFEEAVRYYMQTGQIWNGGEVPVIEDKLFLSIVDELREPAGKPEGKAWPTRLPTTLTILQAQSIGLKVDKALPFNTDVHDFEDPSAVPHSSSFLFTDAELGGATTTVATGTIYGRIEGNDGINSEIMLRRIDQSPQDFTSCDDNGKWSLENIPVGKYQINLDENENFKDTEYDVIEGSKIVVIEVLENQNLEINLVLKKL